MRLLEGLALLFLVTTFGNVVVSGSTFNFFECYDHPVDQRMPNTMDSLIGMVERYEIKNGETNMDEIAEMIINRYRIDGIIFDDTKGPHDWHIGDHFESDKEHLLNDILNPSRDFDMDSFEPREECGLHHLVSHSIDIYPHKGVNDVWDNSRSKRSPQGIGAVSSSSNSGSSSSRGISGASSSSSSSSSSSKSSSNSRRSRDTYSITELSAGYSLPAGVDPAVHPIESGVMETPYGPVAAGTLLAGIMALGSTSEYSISSILGDDVDEYMPDEMKSKTINRAYAASLAGDLSQVALVAETNNIEPEIGPRGMYNNCTTCSQLYSLQNNKFSYFSRAELFAGLDVLIMYAAYHDSSSSVNYGDAMSLSQLLRHYYSERGLPGKPEVKACNRLNLYNQLNKDKIFEQALHFSYAFQDYFPNIKNEVAIHKEDPAGIETYFKQKIQKAVDNMESFINGYNYDDEGYAGCVFGDTKNPRAGSSFGNLRMPPSENMADVIAIYAQEGSTDNMKEQRQMIGDVARRIGVSYDRSRIGVINGKSGEWIETLANVTNIGDWACNFTNEEPPISGSKSDILQVLETLSEHYQSLYSLSLTNMELSSGHSQVVVWQIPSSFQSDAATLNRTLTDFRTRYPDVRIFFVGRSKLSYESFLEYEDDYLSITGLEYEEIIAQSVASVKMSPKYFIYPACDPGNSSLAENYREEGHVYEGYVYPNYTTYLTIPAKNFIFSEELKLKVTGDVRACFSRTNRMAMEDYMTKSINIYRENTDDTLVCIGGPNDEEEEEITMKYLCSRHVIECNPIHISITGLGTKNSRGSCTSSKSSECEFVNQIEYELSHDGMVCGVSALAPYALLLLLCVSLQKILL